jgi:hypothetical protein
MFLTMLVLFAALTPGILFTIPGLGKNLRGKVVTAAMHAVLFVILANLLDVYEGFQIGFMPGFSAPSTFGLNAYEQAAVAGAAARDAAAAALAAAGAGVTPKRSAKDQKKASKAALKAAAAWNAGA